MKSATYKFSEFYLNPFDRTLHKNDSPVEISSKAFDFLLLLVEKSGETVTKEEILDAVWGESFVEEGNLTVHISRLRKLLGASKRQPLIKTVTGRGYQFVANVEIVRDLDDADNISSHVQLRQPTHHATLKPDSIAVLPLQNENGDEEIDYLADGITESLINSLSYMPDFRVIARDTVFRYKDTQLNAQEIGKTIGVSTVLTGRLRVIKENLIIAVELINVKDGTQIWGTHVNQPFTNIFEVQRKITDAIAESLVSKNSPLVTASRPAEYTENSDSYRMYLKARHLLQNKTFDNIGLAIKCFQASISNDPANVLSYIGIGECHSWLQTFEYISHEKAFPLINNFISRANELNPEVPELYVLKGDAARNLEWDFDKAGDLYAKALILNPNHADATRAYANLLTLKGEFSSALNVIGKLKRLDPISTVHSVTIGRIFYYCGHYDNALLELNEALELEPRNFIALVLLGCSYLEMKKFDEAIQKFRDAYEIQNYVEFQALMGNCFAQSGETKKAQEILETLKEKSKSEYVPNGLFSYIYVGLNNIEKAFESLELAFVHKEESLVVLKINPTLAPLRLDPRFDDLLRRIGLPVG